MSACPTCGHSVAVVAWSAEAFIDAKVESANARTVNAGAARWRYAKQRDEWMWRFKAATWTSRGAVWKSALFAKAEQPRRITFTRCYSGRAREMDHANIVGGMKYVVDAMVRCGLLVDDAPRWFEGIYRQERGARSGLHVLMEEMTP